VLLQDAHKRLEAQLEHLPAVLVEHSAPTAILICRERVPGRAAARRARSCERDGAALLCEDAQPNRLWRGCVVDDVQRHASSKVLSETPNPRPQTPNPVHRVFLQQTRALTFENVSIGVQILDFAQAFEGVALLSILDTGKINK
jgi:hypothetical protein